MCDPVAPSIWTVVGIGADGWPGLSESLRHKVSAASTLVGSKRQLDLLPDFAGQRRLSWPSPLRANLEAFAAGLEGDVVALASGDPLVSGIGRTLIELLGPGRVVVHPALSSLCLARARLGWSSDTCAVVSVVGRDINLVTREFAPGRRVLVLSSDETTPAQVAALLTEHGFGASTVHVFGNLGATDESHTHATADTWHLDSPRLNVVALEVVESSDHRPRRLGWSAGLPDEAFEHDGQLTKRDLRSSALARLAPTPGEHLWDIGAGAGSVAVEWLRAHPSCTATAIEADDVRAARVARNASRLGVPGLKVVTGRAPEALVGLPAPDAIFVGGGATIPGLLDACRAALPPGGRLVVHGVTLETEQVLAEAFASHAGELTRHGVETAAPLGGFTGWSPARAVVQWAWTKPHLD